MTDFEAWLAGPVAAWQDGESRHWVQLADLPRAWLTDVFETWGALSPAELDDVAVIDRARLDGLLLDPGGRWFRWCSPMPRPAASTPRCGSPGAGRGGRAPAGVVDRGVGAGCWGAPSGWSWPPYRAGTPELLAWLADSIQEVTMERDQITCHVWPVCPVHQLGPHAQVVDGVAVWWCNGDAGHVLAAVGSLG